MKTRIVTAACLSAMLLATALVWSQDAKPPAGMKQFDRGKGFVERPLEDALAGAKLPPPNVVKLDQGKYDVEAPLKRSLAGSGEIELYPGRNLTLVPANDASVAKNTKVGKGLDITKDRVVERPLKQTLAAKQPTAKLSPKRTIEAPVERTVAASTGQFKNPRVAPGKIRWHKDMQTACAAAKKSGRPVLVFHMIGKLDDRFC